MIEGIFFSTFGVLYKRTELTEHYARRLLKERGLVAELSAEDEARRVTWAEKAAGGQINAQTYWNEYFKMYGVATSGERTDLVGKIMEQVHRVVEVIGARETVKTLKERGFILGIITATMYPLEWKMSWLAKAGVAEFIEVVACSSALGAQKSQPPLYWIALNKAGLTPRQAACVSHTGKELDGARQVGMATVAVLYEPGVKADYYAQTLPDLLNVPIFQR